MNNPHSHRRDTAQAIGGPGGAPRATAMAPTWSLLRLSALQRLTGVAILLACVWFVLARLLGWF